MSDGDRSERYRIRLEATRELLVLDHVVVPYVTAEVMYDTRYESAGLRERDRPSIPSGTGGTLETCCVAL